MVMFILLNFLTLEWDISRTIMTVLLTYHVCNEPTHFSASGYGQLRKYVRLFIVVNCFAYSRLIFVLLDHEGRHKSALNLRQPAKQVACCKQGKIRKSGEWLEDFYGNKTGVPDWYINYGKSAIAEAGEFELMFLQIPRFALFPKQNITSYISA